MKPKDPHIVELFRKYLAGAVTTEELNELLAYFDLEEHSDQLKSLILDQFEQEVHSSISQHEIDHIAQRTDQTVLQHIRPNVRSFALYRKIAAIAAAIIVIVGTVVYMNWDRKQPQNIASHAKEILPGTNRAILTIEGGDPIQLSEGRTTLRNTGDTIGYGDGESIIVSDAVQWATLMTPRAGQYQIVLEDGTKIWLNAASKIKYPTKFVGPERRIYVSGEIYLEVAHLKDNKPFIVETETQTIRVLGTKFNVEAYPDMDMQSTTLVEGKVQVSSIKGDGAYVLRPGQQARVAASGATSVLQVDTQDYIAWIDGYIALNSVNLSQVSQQLERWYDVDFEPIPETLGRKKVFGSLKRDLPLKDVLHALESNYDVKFTINERRINVKER